MSDSFGCVILAAGKGTRLKLSDPKPLVPLMGRRLVDYAIESLRDFMVNNSGNGEVNLVIGHEKEKVQEHSKKSANKFDVQVGFSIQEKQLGTAHALKCYFDQNSKAKDFDYTVIMCADTPLISGEVLCELYDALKKDDLDGVAATFETKDPTGLGRIIRCKKGFRIVEHKDASKEELLINEVNSGMYIVKTAYITKNLNNIKSENASGEFYLTDLFLEDSNVKPRIFENENTFLGVNDLAQLEQIENLLRKRKARKLREDGVRFLDSRHVYIDEDVTVEAGSLIFPSVNLFGSTSVASNSTLETGCILTDSIVGSNTVIKAYSTLEEAKVGDDAAIGPYARLRPKADIGSKSKIGNFVEIKKSKLAEGVKVSHLSYVGDAEIGEDVNIGCGFITCNYDGANKHITKIGKGSFIGSDSQMIAPVTIGEECYVASGSTINQDVPSGGFAIARGRQVTKEGLAKKFIKKK
jgi:bifunctional UDP-N-acetylglucosamine pyrophosphorylase/glucosamine-1-phosphate N-acetyltransferase